MIVCELIQRERDRMLKGDSCFLCCFLRLSSFMLLLVVGRGIHSIASCSHSQYDVSSMYNRVDLVWEMNFCYCNPPTHPLTGLCVVCVCIKSEKNIMSELSYNNPIHL